MNNLQWFRLYHRIIDDEKIRLLAFEDRWHFIALCCLKADGLLDEEEGSLKWRKIAVKMGVQSRELDEIKRRLAEVGLIDDDMQPLAWDALQYKSDTSTDRVRRHREKSKASKEKQDGNVSVTPPETETDTETEATLNSVASAPLPEKSDFDGLTEKLIEAIGEQNIQPHGALVLAPILGLLASGVDLETDILPTIRAKAAKLRRPVGSWSYFVEPIREAYSQRIEAGRGLTKPADPKATVSSIIREKDSKLSPDELRQTWIKRLEYCRRRGEWVIDLMGQLPGREGCLVPDELLTDKDRNYDWYIEPVRGAA